MLRGKSQNKTKAVSQKQSQRIIKLMLNSAMVDVRSRHGVFNKIDQYWKFCLYFEFGDQTFRNL